MDTTPASTGSRRFEARLDAAKLDELEHQFSYHTPTLPQIQAMQEIRSKAKELAILIAINAPPSADTSAAQRKLREAVMTVNAAIVLEGGPKSRPREVTPAASKPAELTPTAYCDGCPACDGRSSSS
jgi:hypothetical protein